MKKSVVATDGDTLSALDMVSSISLLEDSGTSRISAEKISVLHELNEQYCRPYGSGHADLPSEVHVGWWR